LGKWRDAVQEQRKSCPGGFFTGVPRKAERGSIPRIVHGRAFFDSNLIVLLGNGGAVHFDGDLPPVPMTTSPERCITLIGVDFELIGTHLQVAEWLGGKSEVVLGQQGRYNQLQIA